jgi:hypothetical protein
MVRLDVEVGLSGQWRDGQDLVDLGQPSLGLGDSPATVSANSGLWSIR